MEKPPEGPDGKPKKTFQVKTDGQKKRIFVDGELFDWTVDATSLAKAMTMGPEYFKAARDDIEKHFVDSLSEVVGRQLTHPEVVEAAKTGWI
jgi:hypothetical protein